MREPDLPNRIGRAVRELRRGSAQDLRGRLYGDVVDLAQADALEVLFVNGPCKMSEVATALRVDASAATRTIRRLVDAGLVERAPAASDGRAVVVSLTPEGLKVRKELSARGVRAVTELLAEFSPEEQQQLVDTLERFVQAIDRQRRR